MNKFDDIKRTCTLCKKEKDLEEYTKCSNNKSGLQTACKKCSNIACKEYYKKNRNYEIARKSAIRDFTRHKAWLFILEYLQTHNCVKCKENDPSTLQFDHLIPGIEAKKKISKLIQSGTKIEHLINEVNKCQVLCANCHAKRTARQQNWYTLKTIEEIKEIIKKDEAIYSQQDFSQKIRRKS